MTEQAGKKTIYTIPAGVPFAAALAQGILDEAGESPEILPTYTVLLPSRRACRTVREAFLRLSAGKPLLLPRLQPLGDVNEEELSFLLAARAENLALKPAITPLRRQLLLARLIGGMPEFARGPQLDLALARALGMLMDQVYTEDLSLSALPDLVDAAQFADHWQITLDFLTLLSEHWPKILEEQGVMDAAARRNSLLKALADQWVAAPPATPIIAAGSTGSIPATAYLLNVIASLPRGAVVLPGLDFRSADRQSWAALDDTHPQATLKTLLTKLDYDPAAVQTWPAAHQNPHAAARAALAHEIMRPADTADQWRMLSDNPAPFRDALSGLKRYDCATPQEEALVVATALRETLEKADDGRTDRIAALITPDRGLARRVTMACRRWGIEIDDSAGQVLGDSPAGGYLRLAIQAAQGQLAPVALLAFLKSGKCTPPAYAGDWRADIRLLDATLRGPAPRAGLEGLLSKMENVPELDNLAHLIDTAFRPLVNLFNTTDTAAFGPLIDAHLTLAETLCTPEFLWQDEAGEAAAAFFAELREQADLMPPLTLDDYAALLRSLLAAVSVRPAYGRHPRLMILGQIESRMIEADRVILAGLNEGIWPPAPPADPWMSRPMRRQFGLPDPDRGVGLSAHDFVQAFCCPDVILTRSTRTGTTPSVPSRWLARLDTVLHALAIEPATLADGPHRPWAAHIDDVSAVNAVNRPQPRPPVAARPRQLPVTQIEKWLQDPYSIYAKYILRLKPLKPLEQPVDAAIKGTLLHKIMHKFVQTYPKTIPDDALNGFLTITAEELDTYADDPALWSFWMPRLTRLGEWVIGQEQTWRQDWMFGRGEVDGTLDFAGPAGAFTLTARADRIDLTHDGRQAALIDYKSGGDFPQIGMKDGRFPQLPLEALILADGSFEGLTPHPTGALAYWVLTGGRNAGKTAVLDKESDVATAIAAAKAGLEDLITAFDDEDTPYFSIPDPARAPRFNDYEHLARIREWAALEEEDAA